MTVKKALFNYLEKLSPGATFNGEYLAVIVNSVTGRKPYPATCLRYLREWRSVDGRSVPNVSKRKSLYEIKES